jgi:hypothetical protein
MRLQSVPLHRLRLRFGDRDDGLRLFAVRVR